MPPVLDAAGALPGIPERPPGAARPDWLRMPETLPRLEVPPMLEGFALSNIPLPNA